MDDPDRVGRVDGPGQRQEERCGLARRRGLCRLGQAAPGDEFHRVVGTPFRVAHVIDLHHVGVPEGRNGLGLSLESLARPGMGPGDGHLDRDDPVQSQVASPVDDPHPASTQEALYLITGDLRQVGGFSIPRFLLLPFPLGREAEVELGFEIANLPPSLPQFRQQFREIAADLFRGQARVVEFLEQLTHPQVDRHDASPLGPPRPRSRQSSALHVFRGIRPERIGRLEVVQCLRKLGEPFAQPPLRRRF